MLYYSRKFNFYFHKAADGFASLLSSEDDIYINTEQCPTKNAQIICKTESKIQGVQYLSLHFNRS